MRTYGRWLGEPGFRGPEAELHAAGCRVRGCGGQCAHARADRRGSRRGKSRLVTEFTADGADRAMVSPGLCRAGAGGLPYAPFTAALRQLVRARGAAEVAGLLPGQAAGELGVLLPDFGSPRRAHAARRAGPGRRGVTPGAGPAVPRPGRGAARGHPGAAARNRADQRGVPARRRCPAAHRGPGELRRLDQRRLPCVLAGSAAGCGRGAAGADAAGAADRRRGRRAAQSSAARGRDRAR